MNCKKLFYYTTLGENSLVIQEKLLIEVVCRVVLDLLHGTGLSCDSGCMCLDM